MENKNLINKIDNLNDNLEIIFEKNPNSIEGKYENHCKKLQFDDFGFLDKLDIINLSENLLKLIDLEEIHITFSETPFEEKIFKFKAINTKNFTNYLLFCLVEHFNEEFKDTEAICIHKIICKIELEDGFINVYSNYNKSDFNFSNKDIQINALEDYLILKKEYNLSFIEIKELSKKQKRYLIHKAKKKFK